MPFSRHMRPTRSEPSQWNGSAIPPSSLPRAVGSFDGLALVGDVAEHVAVLVLRPRRAEVHADAPVEDLHLGLRVGAAVDAAQPHEAAPVDQLALDAREPRRQRRAAGSRRARSSSTSSDFASAWRERGVELGLLGRVEAPRSRRPRRRRRPAVHSHCGSRIRGSCAIHSSPPLITPTTTVLYRGCRHGENRAHGQAHYRVRPRDRDPHARLRSPPLRSARRGRPVYRTSTFVFSSPEAAERAFAIALGKISPTENEDVDLIYARLSHPNAEILEDQLVPLERGAKCSAVFNSGMAAIATCCFAFLPRGVGAAAHAAALRRHAAPRAPAARAARLHGGRRCRRAIAHALARCQRALPNLEARASSRRPPTRRCA